MSASFPQMAFWVIFPLAALIVLSGWVMIIISAVKKLRSRKAPGGERSSVSRSTHEDLVPLQPNWTPADGIATDGTPRRPPPLGAWRLDNQPPPLGSIAIILFLPKDVNSMPSLPIFFFFSGLSIGLLIGPIIVHSLKAWFSTRHDLRGN